MNFKAVFLISTHTLADGTEAIVAGFRYAFGRMGLPEPQRGSHPPHHRHGSGGRVHLSLRRGRPRPPGRVPAALHREGRPHACVRHPAVSRCAELLSPP